MLVDGLFPTIRSRQSICGASTLRNVSRGLGMYIGC